MWLNQHICCGGVYHPGPTHGIQFRIGLGQWANNLFYFCQESVNYKVGRMF